MLTSEPHQGPGSPRVDKKWHFCYAPGLPKRSIWGPKLAKSWILLARFENPRDLLKGAEKVRDFGYTKFDCYTPYPVHGLDDAMGLKRSILGYVVGAGALGGASIGLLLQWFASSYDYPIVISGKPYFSWQAYMIITFVMMVLGGALSSLLGMFHLNRMPTYNHPLFNSEILIIPTAISIMGFADNDGIDVLPMCSIIGLNLLRIDNSSFLICLY